MAILTFYYFTRIKSMNGKILLEVHTTADVQALTKFALVNTSQVLLSTSHPRDVHKRVMLTYDIEAFTAENATIIKSKE
jgi:hypothetical protein